MTAADTGGQPGHWKSNGASFEAAQADGEATFSMFTALGIVAASGCRFGWACDDFFEDILCRILAGEFRQPVFLFLTL